MYKILIVDDEPASCQNIDAIIRKRCSGFSVCGRCYNGKQALDMIYSSSPDIVITDIKMPVMDGIALAKEISLMDSRPKVIIVSGYSDFSYAQSALRYGVVDYILKPIFPADLCRLLKKLEDELVNRDYEERKEIVKTLCSGRHVNPAKIETVFPDENYYLALVRYGGIPMKYPGFRNLEIFSEPHEKIFIYGRDEREALYICPDILLDREKFSQAVLNKVRAEKEDSLYYTLILPEYIINVQDMALTINMMYEQLINGIVIGKNRVINLAFMRIPYEKNPIADTKILSLFESHCGQGNTLKAKKEVHRLLALWNDREYSQPWIEKMLHRAYYILQKHHLSFLDGASDEEYLISEAFFYSENIQQLTDNIDKILFSSLDVDDDYQKLDSEKYYTKIMNYITDHFQEPITLQSTCKALGISQAYLSMIMKKYGEETFKNCLTRTRIEYAKELMSTAGKFLKMKDIAEQSGFKDQFSFSKIFRSSTGMCPTEFLDSLEN